MNMTNVTTPDGFVLRAYKASPPAIKARVLLIHGITADSNESGELFVKFEIAALERSVEVVRFDSRGHGKSSGDSLDVTLVGLRTDAKAVASTLFGAQLFSVVAVSFGADAGVTLANECHVDRLVLWNPVLDYDGTFIHPSTKWGEDILDFSNSADLPRGAWTAIPGKSFYLSERLKSEMSGHDLRPALREIGLPVRIYHGDSDAKVAFDFDYEFPSNVEVVIMRDEGHGFHSSRQELITDTLDYLTEPQ